jgi:hypothetical protein
MAKKLAKRASPRKTVTKKAATKAKTAAKKSPRKVAKTKVAKAKAAKPSVVKSKAKATSAELDLSPFPLESLVETTVGLCLACALDVLTRYMGLTPDRARSEIRRYSPTLDELKTSALTRPYFAWGADECPYCHAASRWHAPLKIIRIEGGKTTDAARRALVKKIAANSQFTIVEEKSTEREALYAWLSKTGSGLDLDSPGWLMAAAQHWLGRRLPNESWTEVFGGVRVIRRSRRLEEGFEKTNVLLFLAPALFDEILLIQYLFSRSHKAGGQTFEGRFTLQDLFHRLRRGGYLKRMGISTRQAADALEQLVEILGGEGRVKFHYIVDRREYLTRLASLKDARIPRPSR